MTNENVDTHSPEQAAAWLRKRADENRRVAALPPDQWPRDAGRLQHFAFRFEQVANTIECMAQELERRAPEPGGDWVRTSEREPTAADARNGRVLVFYPDEKMDADMEETHWSNVTEYPNLYPWWRPMPSPPNRE